MKEGNTDNESTLRDHLIPDLDILTADVLPERTARQLQSDALSQQEIERTEFAFPRLEWQARKLLNKRRTFVGSILCRYGFHFFASLIHPVWVGCHISQDGCSIDTTVQDSREDRADHKLGIVSTINISIALR